MEFHCLSTVTHPSSSLHARIQGVSFVGCKLPISSSLSPYPLVCSSPLPNSFSQRIFRPFFYKKKLSFQPSRAYRGRHIVAEAEKKGWDVGRFLKKLCFFYGPPSPAKFFEFRIEKLSGPSPSEAVKAMATSEIVLVAGATGGVGRRVVDLLRKKGLTVRALVKNEEKARKMLGQDVDLVRNEEARRMLGQFDMRHMYHEARSHFFSATVGPKEGDTPDGAKYYQIECGDAFHWRKQIKENSVGVHWVMLLLRE